MSLFAICLLLAVVALAPVAWYLLKRGADPFNPMVFLGGLAFVSTDRRLLFNPGPALDFMPASAYKTYLYIAIASLLALYAGWAVWKYRHPVTRVVPARSLAEYRRQYDPVRLLIAGMFLGVLSLGAFVVSHGRYRLTGYIRDLMSLNLPAAVLIMQAIILDTSLLWAGVVGLGAAMARSVFLFFSYGSRGQTASVAALVAVPYLIKQSRPLKPVLVAIAVLVGLVMLTLTRSRVVLSEGLAQNRVGAVILAVESMFNGHHRSYTAGSDTVVGAAEVQAVQALHNWGYGGGFLWDVVTVFPPHEWFPNKGYWQTQWGNGPAPDHSFLSSIHKATGVPVPPGSGQPGFGQIFVQYGWFFPLFWFALGYVLHYCYSAAIFGRRLNYQAFMVIIYLSALYLVTQGPKPATFVFIFAFFPALLAYRWSRLDLSDPLAQRSRPRPIY